MDAVPVSRERLRYLAIWLVTVALVAGVSIVTIPASYDGTASLSDFPVQERDDVRRALETLHLRPVHLAWYWIIVAAITNAIYLAMGWLLVRRGQPSGISAYVAVITMALGAASYPPDIADTYPGRPIAQAIILGLTLVAVSGFFVLPLIFPDGRFVPRWTLLVAVYIAASFALLWRNPGFLESTVFEVVSTLLLVAILLGAPIYRYRRVSTPEQRRQSRWVMFGFVIGLPAFFIGDAMMRNIDGSPMGMLFLFGFMMLIQVGFNAPFLAVGGGILFHRLFDIDVVLNRTLVWLIMTAGVIAAYIAIVLGIGGLLGSDRNLLLSLLATGLLAVAFQPARAKVQHTVDRLVFGERDDPYAVLSRIGRRIEETMSPGELLPQILHTMADALRLPYAALFLDQPTGPVLIASSGTSTASTERFPLMYQGQPIGTLEVANRTPGEAFGAGDRRLLLDLARQIGMAARAVSLANELQESRERIITSREEERRRLRRDIHDGLGARLAGLIMEAGNARRSLRQDPEDAETTLMELQEELRAAVVDVRRLVLGLRPPALDEIGLVSALQARLAHLEGGAGPEDVPFHVRFTAKEPLPALGAATEVAAFRIIEEAVANAVRHSRGTTVTVDIRTRDGWLVLTVTDDGAGFSPAPDTSGLGLQSMRERSEELGGRFVIGVGPNGRGTQIRAALPLPLRGDRQEHYGPDSRPDR